MGQKLTPKPRLVLFANHRRAILFLMSQTIAVLRTLATQAQQ